MKNNLIDILFNEIPRIVLYGGAGLLAGHHLTRYGMWKRSREGDSMFEKPIYWKDSRVWRSIGFSLAIVAILLTGVTAIKNDRDDNAREKELCTVVNDLLGALDARSKPARAANLANIKLWEEQREVLIGLGAEPTDPIIVNIDRFLEKANTQLDAQTDTSYPEGVKDICGPPPLTPKPKESVVP